MRSWSTIVLVAGLAALLVVLGVLQYRWLSQVSESEGDKARRRAKEQVTRFAADFNREMQNAYFNFQTDAQSWREKDWNAFNERYDYWREKAAYKELITDFYFFDASAETGPIKYDRENRSFIASELTPELADLRSRFGDEKSFKPVHTESFAFVLPIHDNVRKVKKALVLRRTPDAPPTMSLPERYGYLVIKLDPTVITHKLVPDLTARHFGDGEFNVGIKNADGQMVYGSIKTEYADAAAPLFDLSPENLIFFAGKDLMSSIGAEHNTITHVNSHVESRIFNRVETTSGEIKGGTVRIEVKEGPMARRSMVAAGSRPGSNPWTLQVQHASGSIDAFVASTLRRNLAIGFGILLLLAGAIAAIIISAMRSKMLAQRQIDFVSSVSHEFRTPLAVIYSAGENLADGVTKETSQIERYGDLIKGEGRKLSSMVEQILDFAGARSGHLRFKFAETEVGDVINAALQECRPMIEEKRFKIETDVSTSLPSINADGGAVGQAIQNLIANSIKYSNRNGWLRVTAKNGDGKVSISVEDRGIGIAKSELRKIFEPFYRSKTVVDAQIHGNGLGLSLVRQIVEAHGGRVLAESELGKGSKFTIELPQN